MKSLLLAVLMLALCENLSAQCTLPGAFDCTGFTYQNSATDSGLDGPMVDDLPLDGEDICITNTFEIDADIEWRECNIKISQGYIIVKSGYTLTITESSLVTTGSSVDGWNGILVEQGGNLIIEDASTVCRAITAVQIETPASSSNVFRFEDVSFIDNYRGIFVEEWTGGQHPAEIHGVTFKGVNALPTGSPTTYSSIGIQAEDVGDAGSPTTLGLLVGDPSELENTFENLDIGVDVVNSTVLVQNSTFIDIDKVNSALNLGIAVRGVIDDASTTNDLYVGTSSTRACTFEDCRNGVQADGYDKVKISDNEFGRNDDVFSRAILVQNTLNDVVIADNSIDDFKDYGIRALDNEDAELSIRDNIISSAAISASCDVTGIKVHESSGTGAVTFEIKDNVIDGVQIGIELANTETIQVEGNDIDISQQSCSSTNVFGITAWACDDATIQSNRVGSDCSGTPCTDEEFFGIFSLGSVGILFRANKAFDLGWGIAVKDDNGDGNAVCNAMRNCKYGFGFNSVAAGEFGPVEYVDDPGEPSDNRWYAESTANRTRCENASDCDDIYWYYRDGSSTPPGGAMSKFDAGIGNSATSGGTIMLFPVTSTNDTSCNGAWAWKMPNWGSDLHSHTNIDERMKYLLDSTANASPASMSNVVYSYLELAHLRMQDELLVTDLLPYTNILELDSAETFLQAEELSKAEAVLMDIDPINDREALKLAVLWAIQQAKENRSASGFYSGSPLPIGLEPFLDTMSYGIVDSIALLEPGPRGDAVIMARTILDRLKVEWPSGTNRIGETSSSLMELYPNPARDEVYIRVQDEAPLESVSVIDLTGRLLISERIEDCRGPCGISVDVLVSGVYIITIRQSNGQLRTGRILIAR